MRIKILGTESLGVRGLSCLVETRDRKIVIDPGVALGYQRHKLLPHPFQVAVGERVRQEIIRALKDSTDIVISHFHGDHIPLADANPYQLAAQEVASLFKRPRLWCKDSRNLSPAVAKRYRDLSEVLGRALTNAEGQNHGLLRFSHPVPHGEFNKRLGKVMMTRIQDEERIFVHASDIQLLDGLPITQILDWKPDIVLASGPPLYLPYLSSKKRKNARHNAARLAQGVNTLILDHHLLRCEEGYRFLEDISSMTDHKVICAADFMGCRRLTLEAWRRRLYREMPVSEGWHQAYAHGQTDTIQYRNWRGWNFS
jgi:predicted metallo-beta-lactamase superfamily hydrolase